MSSWTRNFTGELSMLSKEINVCVSFSYLYYSDHAISYTKYIMECSIMAQRHGLTMSL